MSTLITGGRGLLGSAMTFGLKPSRQELDVLDSIKLEEYIINNKVDSVIHAAAKVGGVKANADFVYDYFSDNLSMSMNVMNMCKKYRFNKAIFVLSTCIFPSAAPLPLGVESLHQGEPHYTNFGYAYAKRMLDVGARALKQQHGVDSSCIIACNLYGENDNYSLNNGHVIPSLIHKCWIAKNTNTTMEVWGSGRAEREFIYVKDLAKIIDLSFHDDSKNFDTMIVSPDSTYAIEEIVYEIVKQMKFDGNVYFDKSKPEGILKKNSCNKKFKSLYPDFKFTSLDEGLSSTIEYFIKHYTEVRK
jgi:GDP-L-fucose synthase